MQRSMKIGAALLLGAGLTLSGLCPPPVVWAENETGTTVTEESGALLNDLLLDQLPFGQPGSPVRFNPDVKEYQATAYYHSTTLGVVVKPKTGVTVKVNGQNPDGKGRVKGIPLTKGNNTVSVVATKDGRSETYTINVNKVDTDFRGHVLIPATVKGETFSDDQNKQMTDGDRSTSVTIQPAVQKTNWEAGVTGMVVTLPEVRQVHRINVFGEALYGEATEGKRQVWWEGGSNVAIQVRASDDGEWTTVATRASMRRESKGLFYWDFTTYYQVKQIRFWLTPEVSGEILANTTFNGVKWEEVEVWGLPAGETPPQVEAFKDDRYTNFDPAKTTWGVNRSQALALQYGILMPAWVPASGYGRGTFDQNEQELTGGAFPMFTDDPFFDENLMNNLGTGAPWALGKAPTGHFDNNVPDEPTPFLKGAQEKWASSLVDLQMGDEEGWASLQQNGKFNKLIKWIKFAKQQYPGAVVHTNQALGTQWNYNNTKKYLQQAEPDLLSFDVYPYNSRDAIPNRKKKWQDQTTKITRPSDIISDIWWVQRQVGLEGVDGTGEHPIMYGQYLDYSFDANVSESQKAITPYLGLATGQKWFGLFRIEYNGPDFGSIIDPDGAPTTAFYEYSDIFKDMRGLGTYLNALNNTFVVVDPGEYSDSTKVKSPGESGKVKHNLSAKYAHNINGTAVKAVMNKAGVDGIESVVNRGSLNQGKRGDVTIGSFEVLPGLSKGMQQAVFGRSKDTPSGFMVVNSLVGPTESPADELFARNDSGSYWETAQDITVKVKAPFAGAELMVVDPVDYQARRVPNTVSATGDAAGDASTSTAGDASTSVAGVGGDRSANDGVALGERYGTGSVSSNIDASGSGTVTISNLGGGRGRLFFWRNSDGLVDAGTQTDPVETSEVGTNTDPVETSEIGVGTDPVETSEIGVGTDPIETSEIGVGTDPVETSEIGVGTDPVETNDVGVGTDPLPDPDPEPVPVETADAGSQTDPLPSVTPSSTPKPSETAKPSDTAKPSESAKPTVKPSETVKPTVKPTQTVKPSDTAKPSNTAGPSGSQDDGGQGDVSGGGRGDATVTPEAATGSSLDASVSPESKPESKPESSKSDAKSEVKSGAKSGAGKSSGLVKTGVDDVVLLGLCALGLLAVGGVVVYSRRRPRH